MERPDPVFGQRHKRVRLLPSSLTPSDILLQKGQTTRSGRRLDPQRRPHLVRQRPLRGHHRRPRPKPPRPRRPLDVLLVAVAEEGLYPDLRLKNSG